MRKDFWMDHRHGKDTLEIKQQSEKQAFFGYETVPEKEKSLRVLKHFNSVAEVYDFMNTLLSFGIHHIWKTIAVRRLGLSADERVLDVCGGTGDLAVLAARATGGAGRVVIYDINHAMMMAGKRKPSVSRFGNRIVFVQGDAEAIAFPDNTFDASMVGFGIRNVTHMEKGFSEMFRILKPGGRMMCLEFSKPRNPVFRWLYDLYSFYVMPFLGEFIAGSRKAYTHLPESIRTFPLPHEISRILQTIGFSRVNFFRLTNGIAVVHTAVKP
jgi:demethylmenaquinone methyltransferase/2-methoxy-6-polyprenyl-1,4-benzoquinol methylase